MADQGIWFKLWITALHDPDLANLPLEDFARWALLGTYIKAHGTAGKLRLTAPARALCALLHVPDFAALHAVFRRLPNVIEERDKGSVSPETTVTVSYRNWAKYQGDYSTARVRKFREMKRSKRRGEEKRREENITSPVGEEAAASAKPDANGFASWPPEWEPIQARIQTMPFLTRYARWLQDLPYWQSEDEQFRGVPATLADLLTAAAGFCERDGYVPRSKRGIRRKLHNCMEFEARRVERAKQG